jgi:hypothetical protein
MACAPCVSLVFITYLAYAPTSLDALGLFNYRMGLLHALHAHLNFSLCLTPKQKNVFVLRDLKTPLLPDHYPNVNQCVEMVSLSHSSNNVTIKTRFLEMGVINIAKSSPVLTVDSCNQVSACYK